MSKKLILFLMLAIFGSTSLLKAEEVTIGDPTGTTTNYNLPTYSLYNYSFTQQIYTAEEIGMAGTINSFTMWLKNTSSKTRNVAIYMKNVTKSEFAGLSDWEVVSAADIVCTSTIAPMSAVQEVTFTLDEPFVYDGESNLLVCFNDLSGEWQSGVSGVVFGTTADPNRALYVYRDSAAFDPAAPGAANGSTVSRDVIRLDITPMGGGMVTVTNLNFGQRPSNGWMEPVYVTVKNNGSDVVVSTNFVTYPEAFDNSTMLDEVTIGYREEVNVEIKPASNYVGAVESVMAVNYSSVEDDIVNSTITGEYYIAPANDIVETATSISFYDGYAELYPDMANMHPNYSLPNSTGLNDVVYKFTTNHLMNFSVGNFDGFVALYKAENGVCHPMMDNAVASSVAPLATIRLVAGTYYLVLATSDTDFGVGVSLEELPELTQNPTLVSPANMAVEVSVPTTLTWTLPEGTAEYRVLLNTVYNLPEATSVVIDWTSDLATTATFAELFPSTQYFWQVQARNANGTVVKKSDKWGFTTVVPTPKNLEAEDETVFEGDIVNLKWKDGMGGGFEGEITVCEGTTTNSYVPVYGLYTDAYLKCNMVYPAEMLEEMDGGEITSMRFYLSTPASAAWDPANFTVYMMEVPGTTIADFVDPSVATVVYTGSLNGTGSEMVVTFDTPYEYNGGNLLVGINNTVIGTFKSCGFYGVDAPGACVQGYSYTSLSSITPTQRNFLPKTTFVCGGAKGTMDNRSFLGYNLYNGNEKVNTEIIVDRRYNVEGLAYNMDGYNFGVTTVCTEGESAKSNIVNVKVSGNGAIAGHAYDIDGTTPLVGVTVTLEGEDEFGDEQTFTSTTGNGGIYFSAVKAGTYTVTASLPEFSDVVVEDVVITYANTLELDFIMHECYNPVGGVLAEEVDETMSKVSWTFGSMPGPGGAGDEFEFGFENDLEGWTNIDADGDGHMWYHSTEAGNHSTLAITSHTGAGHVMGESYCNATWAALTPNDFLVTPQKYNIGGSSVLSFYACAQDASYAAEHFGVAISTASNTSAADFTTISEWTLTAKGGAPFKNAGKKVRGGTREGSWYQYTCDLSAYAGQQAWIAIRHFNCSDMFIMCVDDVTMTNLDRSDRSLQYYTVYRQQVLEEGATAVIPEEELNPEVVNPMCLDTAWVDFNWANMETGVYQYGVQVTYGGNHRDNRATVELVNENFNEGLPETWTNTSEGVNFWIASDLSQGQSAYEGKSAFCNGTWERDIKSYLATPAIELTGGEASLSFVYRQASWGSDQNVLSVVYGDNPDGPWTEIWSAGEVSITEWTEKTIDLTGIEASYIAFCNYNDYSYAVGVDNVVITVPAQPESPITNIVWSNYLPKNMDMTLNLTVTAASLDDVRGAVATFTNVSDPETIIYTAELDSTGLYTFEEFRKGQYEISIVLAGYGEYTATEAFWEDTDYAAVLTEAFNPVEDLAVSHTGYAHWTAPTFRGVEGYMVMLNNVAQGSTTEPFMILDVTGLEENHSYPVKVAAVYTTGMSAWTTVNFTYKSCENYASDIEEVTADVNCMDVLFTWGDGPVPPQPGEGDEFAESWDSGLNGWTNIDADGDGHMWYHSSDAEYNHSVLAPTSHSGAGHLMGESYCNATWAALTPNDFIVTPQKYSITTGSTFSFWACASDVSYAAEHYGVAISTTGNTSANDFTTIAEWTLTAKEGAKGPRATDGSREGSWYQKTVDLSSYAGQEVWIAIRHFNVTDQFIINIDDATLTINGKGNRDGNWYGYDNGNANEDAIGTGGGNFWWGIMLPAGSFEGTTLSKTAAYDYMAMSGTVSIYQGGASAPAGSALGTANVTMTGSSQYIETEFATPITIDPTQNVWVVYYNGSGAAYPAAVCANTGDANGRWVSLDGSAWDDLAGYGLSYTFMVRAYIEAGSGPTPGPGAPVIEPNAWALLLDGEFLESVPLTTVNYMMTMEDTEEHEFMVVKVDEDYNMSCGDGVVFTAGIITAPTELEAVAGEDGIHLTWTGVGETFKVYRGTTAYNLVEIAETEEAMYIDTELVGDCFYGVRGVSECGMSDMTVIEYVGTGVDELNANTRIYPNPTSGDIHVYAQGMTQITIVNTLGQVVYNQSVKANEMTLNMSQFGAGMYIVNIITENGTSVQRVNVIK